MYHSCSTSCYSPSILLRLRLRLRTTRNGPVPTSFNGHHDQAHRHISMTRLITSQRSPSTVSIIIMFLYTRNPGRSPMNCLYTFLSPRPHSPPRQVVPTLTELALLWSAHSLLLPSSVFLSWPSLPRVSSCLYHFLDLISSDLCESRSIRLS